MAVESAHLGARPRMLQKQGLRKHAGVRAHASHFAVLTDDPHVCINERDVGRCRKDCEVRDVEACEHRLEEALHSGDPNHNGPEQEDGGRVRPDSDAQRISQVVSSFQLKRQRKRELETGVV